MANGAVAGVQLYVDWRDLEPTPNQMSPSTVAAIDHVFCQADAHHKFVVLTLVPGFFTPSWAMQDFSHQYFDFTYGSGGQGYLPIPWDLSYIGHWENVVGWMARRYADNSELSMVSADGPTSVSEEMSLPNQSRGDAALNSPNELQPKPKDGTSSDLVEWIHEGYTPARYEGAWNEIFSFYAEVFQRQYISLSFFQGLPINDGKVDRSESALTLQNVLDTGERDVGKGRFVFQGDGLWAGNTSANSAFVTAQECAIAAIGFQTQGPEKGHVNSVATLQGALVHGAAEGASFIEIYDSLINAGASVSPYESVLMHGRTRLVAEKIKKYGVGGTCD